MKKIRKWSFLGILGVVIAVLFLVSISFMQAQVKIQKKPVKPPPQPEATWAVELPVFETPGTMLYGDGDSYTNNDNEVRIKVEKGGSRVKVDGRNQIVFYYYFSFKLLNPTYGRYAGFQNVVLNEVAYPDVGPSCIFPDDVCMQDFLNQNQHPHPEYEYFNLKFQVGEFSFTESLGIPIGTYEGIEDENWDYNVPVKFVGYSDWIKIRVQNEEDFLDPYHNVDCDERNYDDGDLTNMNIWIVRLNESKWRICVGYNPITGFNPGADLLLQEQYTERVVGKNKKTTTMTLVPLEATGNFSFYIDFIKNPTTTTQ